MGRIRCAHCSELVDKKAATFVPKNHARRREWAQILGANFVRNCIQLKFPYICMAHFEGKRTMHSLPSKKLSEIKPVTPKLEASVDGEGTSECRSSAEPEMSEWRKRQLPYTQQSPKAIAKTPRKPPKIAPRELLKAFGTTSISGIPGIFEETREIEDPKKSEIFDEIEEKYNGPILHDVTSPTTSGTANPMEILESFMNSVMKNDEDEGEEEKNLLQRYQEIGRRICQLQFSKIEKSENPENPDVLKSNLRKIQIALGDMASGTIFENPEDLMTSSIEISGDVKMETPPDNF